MKNVREVMNKIKEIREINENLCCSIETLRKDIDDPNWYNSNIMSIRSEDTSKGIHVELDDDEIYRKEKEFDKIEAIFAKAYAYLEEYSEYLKSLPIIDYANTNLEVEIE